MSSHTSGEQHGVPRSGSAGTVEHVEISQGGLSLPGMLSLPPGSRSLVLFAHGSGSSMHSPRNRWVAAQLTDLGHGTMLFDLLTESEAADRARVFDIGLLAERLIGATEWASQHPSTGTLSPGYFGASTGAAAALSAAAQLGSRIGAVVSRGGRPDLATDLAAVVSPTLLIVGGSDSQVLDLNRQAAGELRQVKEVAVVPGAGHLFEEPGALEQVAELAGRWFDRYL